MNTTGLSYAPVWWSFASNRVVWMSAVVSARVPCDDLGSASDMQEHANRTTTMWVALCFMMASDGEGTASVVPAARHLSCKRRWNAFSQTHCPPLQRAGAGDVLRAADR